MQGGGRHDAFFLARGNVAAIQGSGNHGGGHTLFGGFLHRPAARAFGSRLVENLVHDKRAVIGQIVLASDARMAAVISIK